MQECSGTFSALSNIYVQNFWANGTIGDLRQSPKYTPEIAYSKSFVYQ